MNGEITLLLGGARSGKSAFAEKIAFARDNVTYIATADVRDAEMEERVRIHKSRRPASWKTWEGAPEELPDAVSRMSGLLLMDCLTMWLTRLMLADDSSENESEAVWLAREAQIRELTERLCGSVNGNSHLVIVSNEVGCGIVPMYKMSRRFRDMQGRMNQLCALKSTRTALIVAGYPLWVKGSGDGLGI